MIVGNLSSVEVVDGIIVDVSVNVNTIKACYLVVKETEEQFGGIVHPLVC